MEVQARPVKPVATTVQHTGQTGDVVTGPPSVSAEFIDNVLCAYKSPACGTGQTFYTYGVTYGIDPVYALAFYWHESNFGKSGMATVTLNVGNLRSSPVQADQYKGYARFNTWEDSIKAWFMLISSDLYVKAGLVTVEQIVPKYAPSGDNNSPEAYIADVEACVALWRAGKVAVA